MNFQTPLLTDLYQLTMASGYWKSGKAGDEAVFHLFFRTLPFSGGYAVTAGLGDIVNWLEKFRFSPGELEFLAELSGIDERPLFEPAFLDYLCDLRWTCDIDAMPEGTLAFPFEPILRVRGPILQGQLVETALLNIINFQTLIATKAARIREAARGDSILEFGLRRAHGPGGAMMASRAAYIGGCDATSNVLAAREYGIPARGTHAHSWVMSFEDELAAFEAYAGAMPNNAIFLVDTYDTLDGVRHAIEVGRNLEQRGYRLAGIRLDSGDLAWLSQQARQLLDEEGFGETAIVASNDLDEHTIESLKNQDARISVWGVGTQLVTGGDQGALGGVYKLSALRDPDAGWIPKMKLSEQSIKISNSGIPQVRRFTDEEGFCGDAIFDEEQGCRIPATIIDPGEPMRRKKIPEKIDGKDLLVPLFRGGECVGEKPSLEVIRERCRSELARLHPSIKRLKNPHRYPAGLEKAFHERKMTLIEELRNQLD